MAKPFSQTLESRHFDLSRLFMFGMLFAVPLALVWSWWFLTAPIPLYENGVQVRLTGKPQISRDFSGNGGARRVRSLKSRKIVVVFPEQAAGKIFLGQRGHFFPATGKEKKSDPIPLTVVAIPRASSPKPGEITLKAEYPADQPDPFVDRIEDARIRIGTGQTNPARILARSSGLRHDSGPFSYSRPKKAP
jgi:hypothetical protein